jgi:hypothetical protein
LRMGSGDRARLISSSGLSRTSPSLLLQLTLFGGLPGRRRLGVTALSSRQSAPDDPLSDRVEAGLGQDGPLAVWSWDRSGSVFLVAWRCPLSAGSSPAAGSLVAWCTLLSPSVSSAGGCSLEACRLSGEEVTGLQLRLYSSSPLKCWFQLKLFLNKYRWIAK